MGRPPLKSGLLRNQVFQMRVSKEFLRSIDTWRQKRSDHPSRAEAIHQLVERALRPPDIRPVSAKAREKAADLASKEIDKLRAGNVGGEEHHQRKRHLIKGPKEFRELRKRPVKTK
jgi:hypothetical protein